MATRFVVHRAYDQYRPGDVIFVYNYLGEGNFKVWFNGTMLDYEGLAFSPYDELDPRCEKNKACWGTLERDLQMAWWAWVRLPDGQEGWVSALGNFWGMDACA